VVHLAQPNPRLLRKPKEADAEANRGQREEETSAIRVAKIEELSEKQYAKQHCRHDPRDETRPYRRLQEPDAP
jgi:hypothetical protein